MNDLNIRFNLSGKTIKRNLKIGNKPVGTQQIIAIISWGITEKISLVKVNQYTTGRWSPGDVRNPKEDKKHKGALTFGWDGLSFTEEQRKEYYATRYKNFRSFKINAKGELIKYPRIKIQTGIFIHPTCWTIKLQLATAPYAWINDELTKIKHIIETTYNDISGLKKFTPELLRIEVQDRMKNGMPRHIYIPGDKANSTIQTIHAISKVIAQQDGLDLDDSKNPNKVPDDLIEFIDYYQVKKLNPKKPSDNTVDRQDQFQRKLERYANATGKRLSITESSIIDISDFIKWRMYDNEENVVRNSEKVTSKNQITRVKKEAVGVGTLNKTKKDLKFFYNRAVDNFDCTIRFSTKHVVLKEQEYDREESDVYLSMEQLETILNLPIEKGSRLDKHRTLFALGCLGGGYRISDLTKLPKPDLETFSKGKKYYTFNVISTKTKAKTKAPIPSELNYLIESYNFDEEIKDNELRDDIKELGLLCGWTQLYKYREELSDGSFKNVVKPYYAMLMPRTCRKTYCSLLYNSWKLPIRDCMEFSGHKTEAQFKKYLRIDRKEKAQNLVDMFKERPIVVTINRLKENEN